MYAATRNIKIQPQIFFEGITLKRCMILPGYLQPTQTISGHSSIAASPIALIEPSTIKPVTGYCTGFEWSREYDYSNPPPPWKSAAINATYCFSLLLSGFVCANCANHFNLIFWRLRQARSSLFAS